MSKRPRCFFCGIGISQKHQIKGIKTSEERLLHAIFNRQVCQGCYRKGKL